MVECHKCGEQAMYSCSMCKGMVCQGCYETCAICGCTVCAMCWYSKHRHEAAEIATV